MNLQRFDQMEAPELRKYIAFLLHQYRVMDAFWFIALTENFDLATAERINAEVWARVAPHAAKDILARFDIRAKGLQGFLQAQSLFPWASIIDYQFEELSNELILTVPRCPPQEARLQRGLGEYACKAMHGAEFTCFAKTVDARLEVTCDFAPPDPHPCELFCRWRFRLADAPLKSDGTAQAGRAQSG